MIPSYCVTLMQVMTTVVPVLTIEHVIGGGGGTMPDTVTVHWEDLTAPIVAVTLSCPFATPVTSPVLDTDRMPVPSVPHTTLLFGTTAVDPSEYVPRIDNCMEPVALVIVFRLAVGELCMIAETRVTGGGATV